MILRQRVNDTIGNLDAGDGDWQPIFGGQPTPVLAAHKTSLKTMSRTVLCDRLSSIVLGIAPRQ